MRTRHWLATLMGGWMALAGAGTANAQPPGMPTNGNPDQTMLGMLPSPYNNTYGPTQPVYQGMEAPGYPPGASPWPGVSPYMGPAVDTTMYQNGFWYNKTMGGGRRFNFQVDAIFGHSSKPDTALIGAPGVNPQTLDSISGLTGATSTASGTTATLGSTQFNQATFASGPSRSATGGSTGSSGSNGTTSTGSTVIFASQNTGVLTDNLYSTGLRGTWGWDNEDGSGFVLSGFWQPQSQSRFDLVDPLLDINPNTEGYNPLLHLHAWFGLPLAGADTDNTSSNGLGTANDGAVIPYDMGVHVWFNSALAGANTDWFFNPIYDSEHIKIRTLAGGRYIRLAESFGFEGQDSGMGYTVTASSSGGTSGGSTTSTTGTTGSGYLVPSALTAPFNTPNVLTSYLNSSTMSNMGGAEIGLRLDMGGKKFQFYTTSKFGALANVTQRTINGYGIGNDFNITTVNGVVNTVPVMPNDPAKTQFSTTQTTTTLSPMFEQQFNVKMPIFNLIPYLNKMEAFERAQITAGYTFLWIGDIYRPNNTIVWNQYPNIPQLNNTKSNFYNQMVNVGIEWTY